ncbi:MAG: FAD-dependent oxidoreductase [Alphaproteobacteria bacterium]|nr:FAD-dependent oxidoreductase [Alphaproteobacteria bacterium]
MAIVGAGVAGLTAAEALMAAKKKVVVLEARDRIGGRTFTDPTLGFPFDLGAQWIDPPLAKALGGKPVVAGRQAAVVMKGRELKQDEYAHYAKLRTDYAVKAAQVRAKLPGLDPRTAIGAKEPIELLAMTEVMREPPFEQTLMLADGIGAAVARWAAKVPVKTGVRVVRIDSTEELVRLVTPAGDIQARAVIVTVPPAVLAQGGPRFAPALNAAKQTALGGLVMHAYAKVAVAFPRRVLDVPADLRLVAFTRGEKVVEALVRPAGREAAIVTADGEEAAALEASGPSAMGAWALSALADAFGSEVRTAISGTIATRWTVDPLARGAWTTALLAHERDREAMAAPHHDRVFFAGEATETGAASNLEGAHGSGLRAAQQALALLGR